jgi:hypothetical protein
VAWALTKANNQASAGRALSRLARKISGRSERMARRQTALCT